VQLVHSPLVLNVVLHHALALDHETPAGHAQVVVTVPQVLDHAQVAVIVHRVLDHAVLVAHKGDVDQGVQVMVDQNDATVILSDGQKKPLPSPTVSIQQM